MVLAECHIVHKGPQLLPKEVCFKISESKLNRHIVRNHKSKVDETEGKSSGEDKCEDHVVQIRSCMGVGLMSVPFQLNHAQTVHHMHFMPIQGEY